MCRKGNDSKYSYENIERKLPCNMDGCSVMTKDHGKDEKEPPLRRCERHLDVDLRNVDGRTGVG